MLGTLGADVTEVRRPGDLAGLDALVIPGGESTAIGLLMEESGLTEPVRRYAREHPVLGTCAGLVLLGRSATEGEQPLLRILDVKVRRNAFGRQTKSFEAPVDLCFAGQETAAFPGIFIRAPWVEEVGPGVEVIARLDGRVVGVKQGKVMGLAFHPELGSDTRLHALFLRLASDSRRAAPNR